MSVSILDDHIVPHYQVCETLPNYEMINYLSIMLFEKYSCNNLGGRYKK